MKISKSLEKSSILLKGVSKIIGSKKTRRWILLRTLCASLAGTMLAGIGLLKLKIALFKLLCLCVWLTKEELEEVKNLLFCITLSLVLKYKNIT